MAWWEILLGIVLFIVALGILIGIHELGHLTAAKLFHVYCYNYSIGFGPKLISTKRSKKHETTFSLRLIPLGGFVSMYGEGAELEEGDDYVPPSRSLEGVARYKRAVIISAGVILNFILGYVLIFIHNAAFDHIFIYLRGTSNRYENAITMSVDEEKYHDVVSGDGIILKSDPLQTVNASPKEKTQVGFFIIDEDVQLSTDPQNHYVLVLKNSIVTTKVDPDLNLSLALFERRECSEVVNEVANKGFDNTTLRSLWMLNDNKPATEDNVKEYDNKINALSKDERIEKFKEHAQIYYSEGIKTTYTINPQFQYSLSENSPVSIDVDMAFYPKTDDAKYSGEAKTLQVSLELDDNKTGWKPTGLAYKRDIVRYDAGQSFKVSWDEWCNANSAVFRGLGMLITGQGDVSGFIGIAKTSTSVLSNFGFERYLYLWGMISCNLAIINLLPFPGLDGWQLVVIGYEAIRKKQIPTKIKGIISTVGLVLLFGLMIFILIKDVIGLF